MPRWIGLATICLAFGGLSALTGCAWGTGTPSPVPEGFLPGTPFLDESDEVAVLPDYSGLEATTIDPETVRAQGSYPSGEIWLAIGTLADVQGLPDHLRDQEMVCLIISNDELAALNIGCAEQPTTLGANPPGWGDVRYAATGWDDDEIEDGFALASRFVIYQE